MLGENSNPNVAPRAVFATTHWSVVLAAQQAIPLRHQALAGLCHTYWYPLYAFARRRGHSPHDAQDLTQEFFARLMEPDALASVDRSKGRFRSYLLNSMEHFLANEWRRNRTQRRGGGQTLISLDEFQPEDRYKLEPFTELSPERLYERHWALAFLESVLRRLRLEHEKAGKADLFDALKIVLSGDKHPVPYVDIGEKFGMSEAAIKMSVSRLRRRYGELLREELIGLVSEPSEVDAELRALFLALG